jgi:PPOX class probable F420-dependent enzyme
VSPQIAVNTAVSRDELIDFVSARHHAIVITARADGRPQASPVTCGVDAEGRIVIATYPERAKTRNARRNQQVSVVVLSDDFGGPWVQVDGTAEVLDLPEAVEALVEYFRSISGEHPDWEEYRQAMVRQGKSLLRVTPERWGPVATGGFPPRLALERLLPPRHQVLPGRCRCLADRGLHFDHRWPAIRESLGQRGLPCLRGADAVASRPERLGGGGEIGVVQSRAHL